MGLVSTWYNKTGKYERSKVDFNQQCRAYDEFGEDLQIKRVIRGERFTSVTIGPGSSNYHDYLIDAGRPSSGDAQDFRKNLVHSLTDLFPCLITGQIESEALRNAARLANIDVDDRSSVISVDGAEVYGSIIRNIGRGCTEYYCANMDRIRSMLSSTEVGQKGAPVENMMMNLWRYLRRAIAIELYESGFLSDAVPTKGCITIFYDNRIDFF
ncbi:MAG TPA: hypothetical protein GX702_02560 [Chloroflexi bacterium]|nr:hypothetical protein [Chloroflexota bacterium]